MFINSFLNRIELIKLTINRWCYFDDRLSMTISDELQVVYHWPTKRDTVWPLCTSPEWTSH